MRLLVDLAKVVIGVSIAFITMNANAVDEKSNVDASFANCMSNAIYEVDMSGCMSEAFEKYNAIAEQQFHNDSETQSYYFKLQACGQVENMTTSYICALQAVKAYMYQGDIVQYMSDGKFNSGQ